MKKILYYIPSILFNLLEILVLFLTGLFIVGLPAWQIILILCVFTFCRTVTHTAKHYKSPVLCAIWSAVLFTTIFYVTKIDFHIGFLLTVLSAFVQTGLLDVKEMFMWRRDCSKYQDISDYVKWHKGEMALKEFEERLEKSSYIAYKIYELKFVKNYSFERISEELEGMDNRRIVDELNSILLAFRIFFKRYPHCI